MRSRRLVLAVLLVLMVFGVCLASGCSEGTYCVETLNVGITTKTSARLCGRLTYDQEAKVGFEFWETQNFMHQENPTVFTLPDEISGENNFYYDVANLQPGNSYSYKTWAKASGKDKIYGDPVCFDTDAEERISPRVTTGIADNITSSSATVHGQVWSMGMATAVGVGFLVTTTPGIPAGTGGSTYWLGTLRSPGQFHCDLTGLSPDTTYYYRAWVTSETSVGSPYGEEKTFKTLPPTG